MLLYAVGRSQSIPPNPERRDGILQFSCGFVRIKDKARCSVRVFERYSVMGGNRLSLTLTMFQNGDSPIRLSAITAGGSQAVFFKVNTLGEESFLEDVKGLLEKIWEE